MPIRIDKWYFDLVTDAGDVVVARHVVVGTALLRVRYAGVRVDGPDGTVRLDEHRTGLLGNALPAPSWSVADDGRRSAAEWRSRSGMHGRWMITTEGPDVDLTSRAAGSPADRDRRVPAIAWAPRGLAADAHVRLGDGTRLRGRGYVEHLVLEATSPRLPIHAFEWGRFVADASFDGAEDGTASALAWIRWSGPMPLTVSVVDGAVIDGAAPASPWSAATGDAEIVGGLDLSPGASSRTETIGASVLARVPRWARPFGRPIAGWREERTASRGRCTRGDATHDGWVLAERIELAPRGPDRPDFDR